jgi:OOP family OmpA-OmpF porin
MAASASPQPQPPPEQLDPDGDLDGDHVPNGVDQCPDYPEPINGFEDDDGCPDPCRMGPLRCDEIVQNASLRGVGFQPGEYRLDYDDMMVVRELIEIMKTVPITVTIAGHTDGHESRRDAQQLSERRAESVREYMIAANIEADRISTVGFGAQFPLARGVEVYSIVHPDCPELADGGASAKARELEAAE